MIKKLIIIIIILLFNVFLLSCLNPSLSTTGELVTNLSSKFNLDDLSFTFKWTTKEVATSEFHYGTSEFSLDTIVGTVRGNQEREVKLTGLSFNTTYYYKIVSEINSDITETSVMTFTTIGEDGVVYKIQGTVSYTQVNQPDGWYLLELWDDAFAFTGSPLEVRLYKTIPTSFEIQVDNDKSYRIRMFRDYTRNGDYDSVVDAYVDSGTIDITASTVNVALVITEPAQVISDIEITACDFSCLNPPPPFPSPYYWEPRMDFDHTGAFYIVNSINEHIDIIATTWDQWGNIYGDGTVNVSLSEADAGLNITLAEYWTGLAWINIPVPPIPFPITLSGGTTVHTSMVVINSLGGNLYCKIYVELSTDATINDSTNSNIRVIQDFP